MDDFPDHTADLFDQAAERIGRVYEQAMLTRSPFHLSPCGGCGGPAFQQPCSLCGYYPMGGPDPRQPATLDQFRRSVENSMPGGTGNLATWYFGNFRKTVAYKPHSSYKAKVDDLIAEAARMTDLPNADAVWQHVVVEGNRIRRPGVPAEALFLWSAVFETVHAFDRADEDMSRPSYYGSNGSYSTSVYVPTGLRDKAKEGARLAVQAMHGDDDAWEPAVDTLSKVISELKSLRARWVPEGNLNSAQGNLDKVREIRAEAAAPAP